MVDEIWLAYTGEVKGLVGHIEVSDRGRVRRTSSGNTSSKARVLSGSKNNQGYIRLRISINGKVYNKPVHRLVAEMFCDNTDNKPYVDHINAVRWDNRASNLRWVTSSENNKNPHYVNSLSARSSKALKVYNYLKEANKKTCFAENTDGNVIEFSSMLDLNNHFNTKANLRRKMDTGEFFTSKRSKLKGWRLWSTEPNTTSISSISSSSNNII